MSVITIEPVSRLEGHAKISIFLDDKGNVEEAFFQIVEFRGFEEFCKGRPVEELPRITTRLCGVCPWAHHMASGKTLDDLYGVEVPSAGKKLRELGYCAHMIESHLEHIYVLAFAPDFVVGPRENKALRNILGVIEKAGLDVGKAFIKARANAVKIEDILGGKSAHPVQNLPGGVSKKPTPEEREEIEKMSKEIIDFAEFTFNLAMDTIEKNKELKEIVEDKDLYYLETYYIGLVDEEDKVNFYDGKVKVIYPDGEEYCKFTEHEYLDYIAEHVEPWSYLKFPYLRKVGWKGLKDGRDSGLMSAAPLGRLNVATGMATPKAQEAYERFYDKFPKPCHNVLAFHLARAIETIYAAERAYELSKDPEIVEGKAREIPDPSKYKGEGVGIVEAPRGTLIHHYVADENGIAQKVNLIVATAFNYGSMCMAIRKVAKKLIKNGKADDGILNMVEMAFRAYDPCLACATHSLPGKMPLVIEIYDDKKELIEVIRR